MAWIEFHTPLRDHWKIQRLASSLKVDYTQALGIIACLWLWVAEYAPTGDLKRFNDQEIRIAARTNSDKFSKMLLKDCELMDEKERINDWNKHGLKLLVSNRSRQKKYRDSLRNRNVTVTPTNQPNLTIPNQTKPNKVFIPPTLEQVAAYCKERDNGINPQVFIDHYQANGWFRGKTKIIDWKACVRTWEKPKEGQDGKVRLLN